MSALSGVTRVPPADPPPPLVSGVFQGKILTRGGSKWYKPGVAAPVVKRFAMQPGHEAIAEPYLVALRRCCDGPDRDGMGYF